MRETAGMIGAIVFIPLFFCAALLPPPYAGWCETAAVIWLAGLIGFTQSCESKKDVLSRLQLAAVICLLVGGIRMGLYGSSFNAAAGAGVRAFAYCFGGAFVGIALFEVLRRRENQEA